MTSLENIEVDIDKAEYVNEAEEENSDEDHIYEPVESSSKDEHVYEIQEEDVRQKATVPPKDKDDNTPKKAKVNPKDEDDDNLQKAKVASTVKETKSRDESSNTRQKSNDKLQGDLKAHFKDPYTRLRDGKCCSTDVIGILQLTFMIFKLFLFTIQLGIFANDRMDFVTFLERNNVAMKHLLLKNWDSTYEIPPYPPTQGPYAIYRINELLEHINHTLERINEIPTLAAGSFFLYGNDTTTPITICLTYFKNGIYDRDTQTLSIEDTIQKECRNINTENNVTDYGFKPSIEELLRSPNGRLVRLLYLSLKFVMVSIHIRIDDNGHKSECLQIDGEFQYNNREISGQILVDLVTEMKSFDCQDDSERIVSVDEGDLALAILVYLVSFLSTILSLITFIVSILLNMRVGKAKLHLNCRAIFQIVTTRDLAIIMGNILTIAGTTIKVLLESKGIDSSNSLYDICAVCLGCGCLCVWWTMLHYFSYCRPVYLLFEVMDKSALTVLSFVTCAGLLFIGFGFCGWAVLGPYHIKFNSPTATFQSMIATLNGDEVFVTMNSVDTNHLLIGIFNIIFHTLFIIVFTLIAMNVFIAILTSSYEYLRNSIAKGQKKKNNPLKEFLGLKQIDPLKRCRLKGCCCSVDDEEESMDVTSDDKGQPSPDDKI